MLHQPETNPFETRGLDIEIADKMGARFTRGRFIFEYLNRGELLSRKIRTRDKGFWMEPSGAPLQFWNLDAIRDLPCRPAEPLVITEGEYDAIAVVQACGGYAVSVPNGASAKKTEGGVLVSEDTGFRYLWGPDQRLIPEIEQFDKIILCTDGDDKGLRLRDELAIRITEALCWFVTYPGGCKDANDVLKNLGADALRTMIADAKPLRPGYLLRYSDIPPRSLSITYSTGWEALDKHLMLRRPELMIVTGQPGHGKWQWMRSMAYHLAEAHGFKTAFLTPEDPADRHKTDMKRFALRRSQFLTPDEQSAAVRWVDEHFFI
jgi:twinkle protein